MSASDQALVSVIIVNYNASILLTETVQAVFTSSVPVEVFISDNGSQDNSLNHLRETVPDFRLHIIENNANLGFATANNRALANAVGRYILFLNPDCVIQADTLAKMIGIIENSPEIGMAGPLIRNTDGTEQRGCRREIPTPWTAFVRAFRLAKLGRYFPHYFKDFAFSTEALPEVPITVPAISGAFMLITRDALQKVGPWDERYFLHCEDLDWCMRFGLAGQKILFIPQVIVMHVKGACSQSRPLFVQWHMHKGMIRFYSKFFRENYPLPLWWLVCAGVWFRFGLITIYNFIQQFGQMIKQGWARFARK